MNESNYPPGVSDNDINKYFGDDSQKFADHMDDWGEDYFGDWLETDTYAYAKLLDLLGKPLAVTMPTDPKDLDHDRFLVLLDLAKSQTYFWDQFMAWAWDRWSK